MRITDGRCRMTWHPDYDPPTRCLLKLGHTGEHEYEKPPLLRPQPQPTPKASIGRIVHYQAHESVIRDLPAGCTAAIITKLFDKRHIEDETAVGLAIFPPGSPMQPLIVVYQDEADHTAGSWHWPERVE